MNPEKVIMPMLGLADASSEGTLDKWTAEDKTVVGRDQSIALIKTDKVDVEIPSPADGYLRIVVPEKSSVKVGAIIGWVTETADEPLPEAGQKTGETAGSKSNPEEKSPGAEARTPPVADKKSLKRYSPLARRMAEAQGLSEADLTAIADKIEASGPVVGGTRKIEKLDLEKYLIKNPIGPEKDAGAGVKTDPDSIEKMINLLPPERRAIAKALKKTGQRSSLLTVFRTVEVSRIAEKLAEYKTRYGERHSLKIGYFHFFAWALVRALVKEKAPGKRPYLRLNATYGESPYKIYEDVNLGIAVAMGEDGDEGLRVPVVQRANQLSFREFAAKINDVVSRARSGNLPPELATGGTFTITNPGAYGAVTKATPIPNYPEVAILAVDAVHPISEEWGLSREKVQELGLPAFHAVNISLTFDHNVVDGVPAELFKEEVVRQIREFDFEPLEADLR